MGGPSSLSQLIFEGVRGSTAYLDISLDAISIYRGSCNPGELILPPLSSPASPSAQGGRSSSGTMPLVS